MCICRGSSACHGLLRPCSEGHHGLITYTVQHPIIHEAAFSSGMHNPQALASSTLPLPASIALPNMQAAFVNVRAVTKGVVELKPAHHAVRGWPTNAQGGLTVVQLQKLHPSSAGSCMHSPREGKGEKAWGTHGFPGLDALSGPFCS